MPTSKVEMENTGSTEWGDRGKKSIGCGRIFLVAIGILLILVGFLGLAHATPGLNATELAGPSVVLIIIGVALLIIPWLTWSSKM